MIGSLVSVIIPCYNSEDYITRAITSVWDQSYTNWELIIVDDGSTDSTFEIVSSLSNTHKNKTQIIQSKSNMGVSDARNKGLIKASGSYICFLDSDDYWEANKLKVQVDAMEHTLATLSYTGSNIVDEKNHVVGRRVFKSDLKYMDLWRRNYITLSSAMISTSIIKHGFKNIRHEDYLFWLENKSEKIIGIPDNLTNYRRHTANMTKNKLKSMFWLWRLYFHKTGSIFSSFALLLRNLISRVGRF
jgi:teichuronic acid biosynthesis glycosyltransferase TuaG